jgi:DNA-binding PadR family transcriptional regulator
MEEDGLMNSQTQTVNGKRRRYYTITNYGLEILTKAKKQASELIAEINEEDK